jgi:alpha-tubulin suppressor-like RCC1 family protein
LPALSYTHVAVGRQFACALDLDARMHCAGNAGDTPALALDGTFSSIAAGDSHLCAIRTDRTLACLGVGGPGQPTDGSDAAGVSWGQSQPPSGEFMGVAAGVVHSCALRVDGEAVCFGAGKTNGDCDQNLDACAMSLPPVGPFSEVAVGYTHSCGLRTDGSVTCWGSNTNGRSTPPSGPL